MEVMAAAAIAPSSQRRRSNDGIAIPLYVVSSGA